MISPVADLGRTLPSARDSLPSLVSDEAPLAEDFTDLSTVQSEDHGGIEIQVVREDGPRRGGPWRTLEVWTKNRVYGTDASFICIEIMDRRTGRLETAHPMLGAKLVGGRRRRKTGVSISEPLPLPRMEAMFLQGDSHGFTSAVEHVFLRVRMRRPRE
jgi:hypothetical protein